MSALLAITAAFGSLQIRKAEYWERKHAFLLLLQMFCWWYYFFSRLPFQALGKTESQIRVCIICLFLHWQFFVDRCHTSCKCLLKMLMVFVVLCLLALSCLRKAESQTRVSALALTTFFFIVVILIANVYWRCWWFLLFCAFWLFLDSGKQRVQRACALFARYLQQEQPNAICACRMPVHAGLSNCYHCALRPVWLVNYD